MNYKKWTCPIYLLIYLLWKSSQFIRVPMAEPSWHPGAALRQLHYSDSGCANSIGAIAVQRVNTDYIELSQEGVYSWEGLPYSGVGYELTVDGALWSEMEFRNGIQHGTTREYFRSGRAKREAHYENSYLHGFVREWDESGTLQREEEYELGICLRRKVRGVSGDLVSCYEIKEGDFQFELLQQLRKVRFVAPRS